MTLEAIWQWFVQPLQYDFMVKALLMSAVVGLVCAVLSCYLIFKGWSLMGDAVSHSVLPGVVVAYVLNLPFAVGAFVFGFLSVLTIGFVKRQTRLKEDAVMGIILVIAMLITPGAIGYMLTDRFNRMMVIAVIASVLSSLVGAYASYHLDASTGGCIVVLQAFIFIVTFIFAPKRGLLSWTRLARRERQLAAAGLLESAHNISTGSTR